MKRLCLIYFAVLSSCASHREAGCPAIEKLAQRDAVSDARAALTKGDRHLLMLGGVVGSIPGVQAGDAYQTTEMEGTSDTTTEACANQRHKAERYAARYNQTIIQATGG